MLKPIFFTPERGDVVWISFADQAGREQTGRRPAAVLSPQAYNSRVGLAILCPITTHIKGYPFEVLIPKNLPVEGAILADQAETLDWRAHRAELICSLPPAVVEEALGKLRALLEWPPRLIGDRFRDRKKPLPPRPYIFRPGRKG